MRFVFLLLLLLSTRVLSQTVAEKSPNTLACEDLYEAICLDGKGQSAYKNSHKELSQEVQNLITVARDKAAIALGYTSYEEGLKNKLKDAGLEVVAEPDEEALKALKKELITGPNDDEPDVTEILKPVQDCRSENNALQEVSPYAIDDLLTAQAALVMARQFESKYKAQTIKLRTHDLGTFFDDKVVSTCKDYLDDSDDYLAAENQQIDSVCKNFNQVKRELRELLRLEGEADFQARAENFIKKYTLPDLERNKNATYPGAEKPAENAPVDASKAALDKVKDELGKVQISNNYICSTLGSVATGAIENIRQDFLLEIQQTQVFIESMVDSFYGADLKLKTEKLFNETKSDVKNLVNQIVKDKAKRDSILNQYDELKLHWLEKLDANRYKLNANGLAVLDENATPPDPIGFADEPYYIFQDPDLSHFFELNANYLPKVALGNKKMGQRVQILPMHLYLFNKSPDSLLDTMAHELGHNIDPDVSQLNESDLRSEYKDLLTCYESSNSIRMQKDQAGEVISDYISSEVIAQKVVTLAPENRFGFLKQALDSYCVIDGHKGLYTPDLKSSHPTLEFRISGIHGANPNIRKALGCPSESSRFKTCGLLSGEAQAQQSAPAKQNEPAKPKPSGGTK